MAEDESKSLEYTPTWVVAVVCFVIVLISLIVARVLRHLGKWLEHKKQDALFEALQKLKEELMLLGFISLLLTVLQSALVRMCVPPYLISHMLPCKRHTQSNYHLSQAINNTRRLLSEDGSLQHCAKEGKVPLLSLEALHQLHIFVFVLAVVHVIFCATTMVLGGARIRQWKQWEEWVKNQPKVEKAPAKDSHRHEFIHQHAGRYWRRSAVISWMISFCKQFHISVTKSDYIALREGFIMTHIPSTHEFDFHDYMMRTLEVDFKNVVGISWYLWLFVVVFLLLNVEGWHTYFWMSFLPLLLLLLVGAKLEHIITRLAQEIVEKKKQDQEAARVNPSDEHFWFHRPRIVLDLIHFILFQNAFEMAFFCWILFSYGFHSCIIEKIYYIIPRVIVGIVVQFLSSYSTLPLYALVTQMGNKYKRGMFGEDVEEHHEERGEASTSNSTESRMTEECDQIEEQEMVVIEESKNSAIQNHTSSA
ncbi:hypothetical protein SLE2022_023990 [Rubroshorea leprosula]